MTTRYSLRIKDLRTKRAWPQEQLAEVSGVSVRTIQRLEAGGSGSFESLRAIANAFEVDVAELLAPAGTATKPTGDAKVKFLLRIRSGIELFKIVGSSNAGQYEHDEFEAPIDIELTASFIQDMHDCLDIWGDIEPADRVRVPHEFTGRIRELEEVGLWLFAMRDKQGFRVGKDVMPLDVAVLYIAKKDNPKIVRLELEEAVLPVVTAAAMKAST